MKKFLFLLLLFCTTLVPGFSAPALPTAVAHVHPVHEVVYVTKTGKKYHKGKCRYLKSSKIKTTKAAAKEASYTACKVCKP